MAAKKTSSRKTSTKKSATTSKKKTVVKKASKQELAKYEEQLAADAADAVANEKTSDGNKMSFSDGDFVFKGNPLGEEIEVVIVDETYVNEYYDGPYNKDNPVAPICFSIADDEDELVPHDNSAEMQADDCESCEYNGYGSSETGKGKACKNTRRISVVDYESFLGTLKAGGEPSDVEVGVVHIPPTSLKYFANYKKRMSKVERRPIGAVATLLTLEKEGNYYLLKPEFIEGLGPDAYSFVKSIREYHADTLRKPYEPAEEAPAKKAPARKKTVKRTAAAKSSKKKVSKKKKF